MQIVEYDIHGIVGIRLENPTENDVRAVEKQICFPQTRLDREPDITIRFTPVLEIAGLTYTGLFAGYNADGFFILKSSKKPCKARIPFEKIGGKCEILCESGLRSVPQLIAIINLTFFHKNYLSLHASGFVFNDTGVVLTGWAKGGKTEVMLAFAEHGAQYVADEWTVFPADGSQMFGLAEPVRLWDWHLAQVPRLARQKSRQQRMIFKTIHALAGFHKRLARGRLKRFFPVKALGEALPALKRQLNIRVTPETLFEGRLLPAAKPEKVFLVMSHDQPETRVEPCGIDEIIERMIHSNEFEQLVLTEHYKTFCFAFPGRRNALIENLPEIQRKLLQSVFAGKTAYKTLHPYPVVFEELYQKMAPLCVKKTVETEREHA